MNDNGFYPIPEPGHGTVPATAALTQRGRSGQRWSARLAAGAVALLLGVGAGTLGLGSVVSGEHEDQAGSTVTQAPAGGVAQPAPAEHEGAEHEGSGQEAD